MPHFVLDGEVDLKRLIEVLQPEVFRWGVAVIKTEELWLRADGRAVLAEGVVVEHSRPLHPVAVVAPHQGETSLRLWHLAQVERTPAVQRWLGLLAEGAMRAGCSGVKTTNIAPAVIDGLVLSP